MKRTLFVTTFAILVLVAAGGASGEGEAVFDHAIHVEDAELDCAYCHGPGKGGVPERAFMPTPAICLECHEEPILAALPATPGSHQGDFRHQHQFEARGTGNDCLLCHGESESCTLCHHGENVDFLSHERNWMYMHSLQSLKGVEDCASCHETERFCNDCHLSYGVRPGSHISADWFQPEGHGAAARDDLASCILCHDGPEPLCRTCHDD